VGGWVGRGLKKLKNKGICKKKVKVRIGIWGKWETSRRRVFQEEKREIGNNKDLVFARGSKSRVPVLCGREKKQSQDIGAKGIGGDEGTGQNMIPSITWPS